MRIRRIAVEKLFGSLDHVVDLNSDARVTVILGANGVGKTQLLECVAALFGARLERLVGVPFGTLTVDLDDGRTLKVVQRSTELPPPSPEEARALRRSGRRKPRERRDVTIQLLQDGVPISDPWEPQRPERRRIEQHDLPSWVIPIDFGHWWDEQGERMLTARELRVLHGLDVSPFDEVPPWFKEVLDRTSVRLIETQRLLRTHRRHRRHRYAHEHRFAEEHRGTAVQFAVRDLTEALTERMRNGRQRYHRQSTVLDQSYVDRFLKYEASAESSPEVLHPKLKEIADRRARLERLSLLDAEPSSDSAARSSELVGDDKRLALALFASDMEKKLRVVEPFADELERLMRMVNKKLSSTGKELVTDTDAGFVVATASGAKIDLEHLSSGEQHELVLLYDLLFGVRKGSLVLIDEPELSLHPTWQQEFVDDLLDIAQTNHFDVVLATHSPYIVGARVSLCVSLGVPTSP